MTKHLESCNIVRMLDAGRSPSPGCVWTCTCIGQQLAYDCHGRVEMMGGGFPILCERCTNPMRLDAAYTWHCDTCADALVGKVKCPSSGPHKSCVLCKGVGYVEELV